MEKDYEQPLIIYIDKFLKEWIKTPFARAENKIRKADRSPNLLLHSQFGDTFERNEYVHKMSDWY